MKINTTKTITLNHEQLKSLLANIFKKEFDGNDIEVKFDSFSGYYGQKTITASISGIEEKNIGDSSYNDNSWDGPGSR